MSSFNHITSSWTTSEELVDLLSGRAPTDSLQPTYTHRYIYLIASEQRTEEDLYENA